MFSLSTTGFDQLGGLAGWQFAAVAADWAHRVESRVEAAVKHEAPVGTGPEAGRLRDSIQVKIRPTPVDVKIEVTAGVEYARWVVEGTRPHVIRPVRAKALHWVDGGGGHFAQQVNHPGTHPNNFPERAMRSIRQHLVDQMAAVATLHLGRR